MLYEILQNLHTIPVTYFLLEKWLKTIICKLTILATCRAWFGASLSEVVLRMVYGNVMVMIVRVTVSVQSP